MSVSVLEEEEEMYTVWLTVPKGALTTTKTCNYLLNAKARVS